MKLENQVCSLELARRLKELGVKQESLFCWMVKGQHYCQTTIIPEGIPTIEPNEYECSFPYKKLASAFTVAELGEMLPGVAYGGRSFPTNIVTFKGWLERDGFQCGFLFNKEFLEKSFHAATEADARAKMLIHLIEKGIVRP